MGTAIADTLAEAYARAYAADSVSAFGGIVAVNRTMDKATAEQVVETFIEAVIAPDFDDDAVEVLKTKKNLRLLAVGEKLPNSELWIEKVSGGFLVQERDNHNLKVEDCKVVTDRVPTEEELTEMIFSQISTVLS